MSSPTIDLTPFCATSADPRSWLAHQHAVLGGAAACNGHILVFVSGTQPTRADDAPGLQPDREQSFKTFITSAQQHDFASAVRIDSLALDGYESCPRCEFEGRVREEDCDECDGKGDFLHGSHRYDCRECEASGIVHSDNPEIPWVTCPECCGARVRSDSVEFGDVTGRGINTNYVHLLSRLPDCVIDWDNNGRIPFRFNGGCGVVMPMEGGPRHRKPIGALERA